MTYYPQRVIFVHQNQLQESVDLTKSLGSFLGKDAYLSITQNHFTHLLDLGSILTYEQNLNLSQPIESALNNLFTDLFIERYQAPYLPQTNPSGLYPKRLNCFNPQALSDFHVGFTSVDTPEIVDDPSRKGFLDDLVISSSNDLTNYLVAVNGVFHATRYFNNKLYILDGYRTIRGSGQSDICVVDTKGIGGHFVIPLTSSNITKSDWNQPCQVTLPHPVIDSTIFVVIDGYFYHLDSHVLRIDDATHLSLFPNKMPLIQQFRHNPRTLYYPDRYGSDAPSSARKYHDPFQEIFIGKTQLPRSTLATQDFQYSRLTAFHSFLMVVPNAHLFQLETKVVPTNTPQFYQEQSVRPLSGMTSYGAGLCPTYLIWKDPWNRKSIFIPGQDNDIDYQDQSYHPLFIPALIKTKDHSSHIPLRFIDYVVA